MQNLKPIALIAESENTYRVGFQTEAGEAVERHPPTFQNELALEYQPAGYPAAETQH